jgi:hypothetical protein
MASSKSVRGSGKGYRVFVLTRKGKGKGKTSFSVTRIGRLVKGLTSAEVMTILKKLAPKKTTTAVAVTKTGTIHLAARAKKRGGKDKTSQRVARVAAAARGNMRVDSKPGKSGKKFLLRGVGLSVRGKGKRVLGRPKKASSAKKKTSRK